jgi:adenylate kinase family enzyme
MLGEGVVVRRVVVAGIAGVGKSTFALRLAAESGLPYFELDGLVEGPGWTRLEDFRDTTAARVAEDAWVTDNLWYPEVEDVLLARADTVVWLDLPRRDVMARVARRTVRRGLPPRPLLVNGNREKLWAALRRSSPLRTAWAHHVRYRAHLEAVLAETDLTVVRLQSEEQARQWLSAQAAAAGPRG